jgi:hypothetical protein
MKIEFTRAEVERILLDYVNDMLLGKRFDTIDVGGLSDIIILVEKKDAAQ